MSNKTYEMDMCQGPLFKKIVLYALPLIATGLLQLCYNAADSIIVGRFAGASALAAVGANTHLIDLMINLFLGLSVGINVVVAQNYGAKKLDFVNKAVHTSLLISFVLGVAVSLFGILFGHRLLILMNCPQDILDQATLYLRIYFLGVPASMAYNFGAAVLRAVGNTKQPLYYLSLAGFANVLLNLLLVVCFHMDVAGVAIATIISQYLSAILILGCLMKTESCVQFRFRKLGFQWSIAKSILYIGLPAGLQSTLIAYPNVLLDACVNSFGSLAVAGSAASNNLEGFIHAAMVAISNTAVAFVGQNVGGKRYERISRVMGICLLLEFVAAAGISALFCGLSDSLVRLYLPAAPEAVSYATLRNYIVFSLIFLMGFINVFMAGMRGMGYSITPAVTVLLGLCGVRILWIYTVFAAHRTLNTLFAAFPVSWIVTAALQGVMYCVIYRRFMKKVQGEGASPQPLGTQLEA